MQRLMDVVVFAVPIIVMVFVMLLCAGGRALVRARLRWILRGRMVQVGLHLTGNHSDEMEPRIRELLENDGIVICPLNAPEANSLASVEGYWYDPITKGQPLDLVAVIACWAGRPMEGPGGPFLSLTPRLFYRNGAGVRLRDDRWIKEELDARRYQEKLAYCAYIRILRALAVVVRSPEMPDPGFLYDQTKSPFTRAATA